MYKTIERWVPAVMAVDRKGILYVTEVAPGDRVQRFLPASE
jgi:hypothetical protein